MEKEEIAQKLLLSQYRALDLTDEKGMMCGKILADLGLDVIKVEPPGGGSSPKHRPFLSWPPGSGEESLLAGLEHEQTGHHPQFKYGGWPPGF